MKALVIFYSFTGNTRKTASLLAEALKADLAEFTCKAYDYGLWGALRQALDVFTGGTPPIELPTELTKDYDLVVVAGPVWAARPAPPLRTFIKRYVPVRTQLGLLVTCNGTSKKFPPQRAVAELLRISQLSPVATHIFTEEDVFSDTLREKTGTFAEELRRTARMD